jgi:hypothetical protein
MKFLIFFLKKKPERFGIFFSEDLFLNAKFSYVVQVGSQKYISISFYIFNSQI